MTVSHLFFALLVTGYILTAIQFEETHTVANFSEKYREYKKWAAMIIAFLKKKVVHK